MKHVGEILLLISVWSVLLPAVTGTFYLKYLNRASKYIYIMTALAVIPQLTRYFTDSISIRYSIYNLYMLSEFLFTAAYFWILFSLENRILQKIISLFIVAFLTIYLAFVVFRGIKSFFAELVCLSNLFILLCILICCYQEVKIEKGEILSIKNAHFYYITGWLIYTPLTLLMFALWNFLKRNPNSWLQDLWVLHSLGNVIMYILFSIGFIIEYKRTKFKLLKVI